MSDQPTGSSAQETGPPGPGLPEEADRVHGVADRARLERLRRMITGAVGEVVPNGAPVAYLNFPNHRNAGDCALWLAGEAVLSRAGAEVRIRRPWNAPVSVIDQHLGRAGVVVLNAGGNLGDLYPDGQQRTRELAFEHLRGHPIVQLPQSVHFADPANEERTATLAAAHGRVTVLCRDTPSLDVVSRWPGVEAGWCPDLVFALGPFRRQVSPEVDVVWLARRDPETRHPAPPSAPGRQVLDWLAPLDGEPPWPPRARLAAKVSHHLVGQRRPSPRIGRSAAAQRAAAATFGSIAEGWLQRGLGIVHRGRVLVTDRLHAHLLAWLSGIPSVVLDNSYGKVHAVVRETTLGSPLVELADSVPEALERAERLLAGSAP